MKEYGYFRNQGSEFVITTPIRPATGTTTYIMTAI